ncbi:MAG: HAD family hydrolase, partial [Planctomycetes bacterium]|nr:HAD family hydrolase [Planctomycetota bacterium]
MALDSIIFDVDGTLVDTNPAHVEAWDRAFQAHGYKVARDRIAVEIGKGGDLLVSAVLGQQAEEEHGDDLRQANTEAYLQITKREHFRVFPGVRDLIRTLRQRGLRVALATSSKSNQLEATLRSAGLEAEELGDMVITASEAQTSKPAPDLVIASVRKQDLCPAQCAMVGDTPYDAEACKHAGVVCLGLLCGGNT